MGDDGGENTGVPWFAAVRYAVATVVGLVALSAVVMVITVVRRPEEIQLSINHGYVTVEALESSVADHGHRRLLSTTNNTANYGLQSSNSTTLRVVFTVSNPSGRGDVTCGDVTGGLLGMPSEPSSSTRGMETIVRFNISEPFDVPKESTHTEPKTVLIRDDQWRYILGRYRSEMIFEVAVMVNMSASPGNKNYHPSNYHYFYCWPIIVGPGYTDLDSSSDVQCEKRPRQEIPEPQQFPELATAPAPAPTR